MFSVARLDELLCQISCHVSKGDLVRITDKYHDPHTNSLHQSALMFEIKRTNEIRKHLIDSSGVVEGILLDDFVIGSLWGQEYDDVQTQWVDFYTSIMSPPGIVMQIMLSFRPPHRKLDMSIEQLLMSEPRQDSESRSACHGYIEVLQKHN